MMAGLLTRAGRPLVIAGMLAVIAAACALVAAFLYRDAAATYERITSERVAVAVSERNAFWEGRIEAANAATERRVAEQVRSAMQIEAEAAEKVRSAEQQLATLKVENDRLPFDDNCGLGLERGRMLPR